MNKHEVRDRLKQQDGVISRAQVLAADGDDDFIEQKIRRREWARVYPGVYVAHTGPLSWNQRAWAAVLYHAPSALAGRSALQAHGLDEQDDADPIELVIAHGRRVKDRPGMTTRRVRDFAATSQLHLNPPRVRVEPAVLQIAADASSEDAAITVVADACQRRRTKPERLLEALAAISRIPRRELLVEVLEDVAAGTNSAMERRYLHDVETAHALPDAVRQHRVVEEGRVVYRDVEYTAYGLIIELDGRLGHVMTNDRWTDLDRDLAASESGSLTARVGWRQVLQPCRLTISVGRMLRARGWPGHPSPCSDDCPAVDESWGDFPANSAGKSPQSAA